MRGGAVSQTQYYFLPDVREGLAVWISGRGTHRAQVVVEVQRSDGSSYVVTYERIGDPARPPPPDGSQGRSGR